ncbi:MAG: hypothetical protein HUJ72_06125 [Blautia sp.]|nr:hypothetical protein [Blautia sp.]
MQEYITDTEYKTVLEDISIKLKEGKNNELMEMVDALITDAKTSTHFIDRTYLGGVKEKKRLSRIEEIEGMLLKMTGEQVDNVHRYTMDEYDEPNHEAEALEAIVRLSRNSTV